MPTIQPQLVQLDIKFKGPLTKESQVDTVNDLLTLSYNYDHKLVWVKSEANYFYLKTGFNGSQLNHWDKISTNLVLGQYNPNKTYNLNDFIYFDNKIYRAKTQVPKNKKPSNNLDLWEVITGDVKTVRLLFENVSSFVFYTNIVNPNFQVMLGNIKYNNGIPEIDTDGMIKILDPEIVEPLILRRSDISDNNGKAYEIKFFMNNDEKLVSGVVNIK